MQELYLQDIFIYPIKSLGGISLQQVQVQQTGLQYDRRWMLTDEDGNFLSQRNFAGMALLQVEIIQGHLIVSHKNGKLEPLSIPLGSSTTKELSVSIWDDVCRASEVSADANKWFSEALRMTVRLVYMPETTHRFVDDKYAKNNEIVSFADGYPIMMIGQSSLNDLNNRLASPVPMNRFRPNLVLSGGMAFCEDLLKEFWIGDVSFNRVKPCSRCLVTTINQEDGTQGQEPLRTLASYRTKDNKIWFGQNLLQKNSGTIKRGDKIKVLSTSI